jgi:hypothetical protein
MNSEVQSLSSTLTLNHPFPPILMSKVRSQPLLWFMSYFRGDMWEYQPGVHMTQDMANALWHRLYQRHTQP